MLPLLCAGGAERAIITLMNNLDTNRFNPEMIALDERGPLRDWIRQDITFHSLGGVRVSRAFFKLFRELIKIKPDVVVTTMAHSNFLLLLMRPFFPKTKFIVREAVIPSSILQDHKKIAWVLKFLYRSLYPLANYVLSPSRDIIDEFQAMKVNTKNHRVLYNQVDQDAIQNVLNENKGQVPLPNNGIKRFVCVGRLHHQKGYDLLLSSFKKYAHRTDWELFILGDGEGRTSMLRDIDFLGLNEHVTLLGNKKDPWSYMASADYLLLPSRWEGMPNVVLESLACGTPVVATKSANGVAEIKENMADVAGVEIVANSNEMVDFVMGQAEELRVRENDNASLLPQRFTLKQIMHDFQLIL